MREFMKNILDKWMKTCGKVLEDDSDSYVSYIEAIYNDEHKKNKYIAYCVILTYCLFLYNLLMLLR